MHSRLYSLLKSFIGLPLTFVAFYFIFKTIAPQTTTLLKYFHTVHIFLLLYGVGSFLIFYYLRSYLWYRILKQYASTLSFRESNYLWAMSELKRYIPGNIWSFLGRTVLFHEKGIPKKAIVKGLVIEAELFIIGCVIIALFALPFYFSNQQAADKWLITVLVIGGTVLYALNNKFHLHLSDKLKKTLSFLFPPFPSSENALLILISLIAVLFYGVGNYFVISSVVYLTPARFLQFIGIFDLAFVLGYLSLITPAGFGVREGVVIFSLGKIILSGLAAFGALFSRIMLICSELLFILTSAFWHKFHKQFRGIESLISNHPQVSVLSFLTTLYLLYFTVVSFLRYDNFYAGRFDLGNMAQTVWNSLHGKLFLITDPNGTEQISRLAFHADFILILLAPFYALWENPKMLLLIQTIIVAAGAFFIYSLARDVLKHRNLALVFAFSYLLNPSVQRATIYDFHAVTLVTTFFLAAYYFLLKKKYFTFVIFAVLAALCKEQIWLIVALFGLFIFFAHKKHFLGAILFFVSIAMFYGLIWYAIPQSLGAQHFALAYFSDYGDSPTKIVKSIVLSPNKILQTIFQPSRLDYLNQLFMPIGYLPLFFPFFLIFAGPDLLINLLSNNAQLHQIYYQYTATITPFIFLSAIYAVLWIKKIPYSFLKISQQRWTTIFIVYLLAVSLFGAYRFGPLPSAIDPNLDMFTKQLPDRVFINNYLQGLPKNASVSATNALGSHLSLRKDIYTIPVGIGRADFVVLLFVDPQSKDVYKRLKKDPRYREVVQKNNFVAFQKK